MRSYSVSADRSDQDYDDRFGNEEEVSVFVRVDGRCYRHREGVGASRAWVERMKENHRRWLTLALSDKRDTLSVRIGLAAYRKLAALMDELGAKTVGQVKQERSLRYA